MHLETLKHHGPGRLGFFHFQGKKISTPNFFSIITDGFTFPHDIYLSSHGREPDLEPVFYDYGTLYQEKKIEKPGFLPYLSVGFDTPRPLAEKSLQDSLDFFKDFPQMGVPLPGGKYADLMIEAAKEMSDRPIVKVPHGYRLARNPRVLANTITGIKENLSPNTAIYLPGAPLNMFPLLVYMGVDFLDNLYAIKASVLGIYLTNLAEYDVNSFKELPCSCPECLGGKDRLHDLKNLMSHNSYVTSMVLKEIRESIRNNNLRNLVEIYSGTRAANTSALRIMDLEKADYLDEYTPIAP